MKVLWFTNIMMPEFAQAIGLNKVDVGGWMPSLLSAMRQFAPDIELHVASLGPLNVRRVINGTHYYAVGTGLDRRSHKPIPSFVEASKQCIEDSKADIIHVHGAESPFAALPSEILGNSNLVVSIQGIISAYYYYYYGNLAESDFAPFRNRLREVLRGYSLKADRTYWKCGRAESEVCLLKEAKWLLGRTEWDKAWAEYLAPKVNYAYVGEVLREPFYAGMRDVKKIIPHSIYCGAALTYPLKNGHVAIEAVASLRRKYPDIKVSFANAVNVGKSPGFVGALREGEYIRYIRDLIDRLGVKDNIVFYPSLNAKDVRKVLEESEIFCLPSACENSPNSLGEAMLTGTPSVSTYVGGIPSILENGKEGLLVPSGDPASLAVAIDRMFSDKSFAQTCANNAYVTATNRYNYATIVKQLIEAYKMVLG